MSMNVTTTGWMPESDGRGTFRLLIGCLTTLSLCVYTALHLNIPSRDAPRIKNISTRLGWILMGMFAPELVVFTAWSQWKSAKELTNRINEMDTNYSSRKKAKWTMTHSFFAQMGGFVFDTDSPGDHQYVCNSPRLFLTAHGVAVLGEIGRLPVITKELILDKSKADGLAKALVILQAGWLILQCIARIAANLPISFLEINTVAHIACALIMYILWWEKPLNVKDPIVLSGEWTHPVAAVMWMFSDVSTEMERNGDRVVTHPPEIESLVHLAGHLRNTQQSSDAQELVDVLDDDACGVEPKQYRNLGDQPGQPSYTTPSTANERAKKSIAIVVKYSTPPPVSLRSVEPAPNFRLNLHSGEVLIPFGFGPKASSRRFWTRNISGSRIPHYHTPVVRSRIDMTTFTRWRLASQCLKEYPHIWNRYQRSIQPTHTHQGIDWTLSEYPDTLCKDTFVDVEVSNLPGKELIQTGNELYSVLIFSLCVSLYGGLHAAAWNDYFPTNTERFLWRFSSLYVAGSGLLYVGMKMSDVLRPRMDNVISRNPGFDRGFFVGLLDLIWAFTGIVMTVVQTCVEFSAILIYILARAFLVIEAFISLRRLPVEVYQTPSWTQYLSHF